eukprot:3895408-Amphidinium_carterae.2
MARWVKVKGGDDPIRCKLSTSDSVYDLLMLVKKTLSPALDTVRVDQMKVFEQEEHEADPNKASTLSKKKHCNFDVLQNLGRWVCKVWCCDEAFKSYTLIEDINGGSGQKPLYVHYPDQPQAQLSASSNQQVLREPYFK